MAYALDAKFAAGDERTYTYLIPEAQQNDYLPGDYVLVPTHGGKVFQSFRVVLVTALHSDELVLKEDVDYQYVVQRVDLTEHFKRVEAEQAIVNATPFKRRL